MLAQNAQDTPDDKECSVALSSDSNGNIKIVGNKPSHEDLEKNTDIKVKLSGKELSLVNAIKELEQQNKLSEPRIEGLHWACLIPIPTIQKVNRQQ